MGRSAQLRGGPGEVFRQGRITYHPTTRAYRDTHLARGWDKKAVYRALDRAAVRAVFRALVGRCDIPDYSDLRP